MLIILLRATSGNIYLGDLDHGIRTVRRLVTVWLDRSLTIKTPVFFSLSEHFDPAQSSWRHFSAMKLLNRLLPLPQNRSGCQTCKLWKGSLRMCSKPHQAATQLPNSQQANFSSHNSPRLHYKISRIRHFSGIQKPSPPLRYLVVWQLQEALALIEVYILGVFVLKRRPRIFVTIRSGASEDQI